MPLLFSYLDKMEIDATKFFGYTPKSQLTIQLDFNKEIFKERLSYGDLQRESSGYYNTVLNTIYMNNNNSHLFAQSTYLIHKMIQLKGENSINYIIEKCKTGTFNESFYEVMGISLDDFEKEVSKVFNVYDSKYYAIGTSDFDEYINVKTQCLEEYIKFNEYDMRAYEFLSLLYQRSNGYEKSISFLKASIEKHPNEASLWWQLALLYENNNMPDLAKECYDKNADLSKE